MNKMDENLNPLRALIELSVNFTDGVIIFDNKLKEIVQINEIAQSITGLHVRSSIDDIKRLVETLPDDDERYLHNHLAQINNGKRSGQIEFRLPNEASVLNICASAYKLLDNRFILVMMQDITKHKAHENYLVEFGAKKNATLDGVTHFISGALTLMRNFSTEAAKSLNANNAGANAYLELIDKNASRCLEVVKDILIEEHNKSPEISLKRSRANLIKKVSYILDVLKSAYPARTINFRHQVREIIADIDDVKVLQIINNLVFNAIKFSSPDTTITVGIIEDNTNISIYVADNGIGIPARFKPYIFDRNSVAGRPGLNGEPSFGKGLFICQKLAAIMNGTITFESEEGKGSIFYLILPPN